MRRIYVLLILTLIMGCRIVDNQISGTTSGGSSDTDTTPAPVTPPVTPPTPPACDTSVTGDFGGGDGSVSDPYRICSLSQWDHFAQTAASWSQSIKLEADLDFTGVNYAAFKMVGTVGTPFTGTFDGNSKSIKSITVDGGSDNIALFPYTDQNATLKNFTMQDINMTTTGKVSALIYDHGVNGTLTLQNITLNNLTFNSHTGVGGLVYIGNGGVSLSQIQLTGFSSASQSASGGLVGGLLKASTFSNITMTNVAFTVGGASTGFGGVVGAIYNFGTDSFSFSDIQVTNFSVTGTSGANKVGAVLGDIEAIGNQMSVSYSNISTTGNYKCTNCGGVVGWNATKYFSMNKVNSVSTFPDVSVGSNGGLAGVIVADSPTITESYAQVTMTGWTSTNGGLAGQITSNVAGSVTDSYATGTITQTHATDGAPGGIVGSATGTSLTITNSYFAGSLSSNHANKGCVVAGKSVTTLTLNDIYYDATVCTIGAVASGAYTGATGVSTSFLQSGTTPPNWSTTLWDFVAAAYPTLK